MKKICLLDLNYTLVGNQAETRMLRPFSRRMEAEEYRLDLIDAIKDGTVTCIGTDHAPHTAEEKEKGAAGMVGLETAFGVCYTKLCREQRLPLEMLSFLMSAGPAAVLGLADRKGMLEPGYDADIVLVDLDHMYEVHADELHSKSKNCPYDGALLYGKVVTTIKGGKVTFQIEE